MQTRKCRATTTVGERGEPLGDPPPARYVGREGSCMASMPSLLPSFTAPEALVLELLAWVERRPRTYGETMEVWRTSCPRSPVWEDATANGLISVVPSEAAIREYSVELTAKGRAVLARHVG